MKPMRRRRLRLSLVVLAALLLVIDGLFSLSVLPFGGPTLSEETAVHFIDVGQGDAALLLSGGQAVLIDAGERAAGDTVVSYLKSLGVKKLFAAVATHPHADHIGGMAQVVEHFPVENFYMGSETANTAAYSDLLNALEARGIRPIVPSPGDRLLFSSEAVLEFLGPAEVEGNSSLNDCSLITLFRAGRCRVLFMGDAEAAAEQDLIDHNPRLRCDVLKVGHHGSSTSSTPQFLRTVRPTAAVISCGRDNEFGHPSPETLQNLRQAGIADIRITAEAGTVVIPITDSSVNKEDAA